MGLLILWLIVEIVMRRLKASTFPVIRLNTRMCYLKDTFVIIKKDDTENTYNLINNIFYEIKITIKRGVKQQTITPRCFDHQKLNKKTRDLGKSKGNQRRSSSWLQKQQLKNSQNQLQTNTFIVRKNEERLSTQLHQRNIYLTHQQKLKQK